MRTNTLSVAVLVTLLSVSSASATPPPPSGVEAPAKPSSEISSECTVAGVKLPKDLIVYGAGFVSHASLRARMLDYQIDQSGQMVSQVDVLVTEKDKPVALILAAHNPTIWNVSYVRGARIVAVVSDGSSRQIVAGLSEKTPVLDASLANKNSGCKEVSITRHDDLTNMNPLSTQVFGQTVAMYYPFGDEGKLVIGPQEYDKASVISQAIAPKAYFDKDAPLAGDAGLQDAVAKGIIRPATREDVDQWSARLAEVKDPNSATSEPPVFDNGTTPKKIGRLSRTYVVLRPFTVPAGLTGGKSARFIVSKGVPLPTGDLGHSVSLDMSNGRCAGVTCDMYGK